MQAHIKASFDASPITSQLRWTRLDVMIGLAPLHINNIEHLSLWDIFKLHVTSSLHKHTPKKKNFAVFAHKSFPTNVFAHKSFDTKRLSYQKNFHTIALTHKFSHKRCYTDRLFRDRRFTQKLAQKLFNARTTTHGRFYAQAFQRKRLYTQKPLHTGDFTRLKPGGEGRKASRVGAILFDPSGRHVQYAACMGRKAIASKSLFMLYTIIRQAA